MCVGVSIWRAAAHTNRRNSAEILRALACPVAAYEFDDLDGTSPRASGRRTSYDAATSAGGARDSQRSHEVALTKQIADTV